MAKLVILPGELRKGLAEMGVRIDPPSFKALMGLPAAAYHSGTEWHWHLLAKGGIDRERGTHTHTHTDISYISCL